MDPNQTSQETSATPEAPATPEGRPTELAAQPALVEPQKRSRKVFVGLALIAISVVGALGLIAAYLPLLFSAPATQTAAVGETKKYVFFKALTLTAKSAYVYDVSDGRELFSKNAEMQLPLASITKVALVLSIAEVLPLDSKVTISRAAAAKDPQLQEGEVWRVRDLIDYTLMTSSNAGAAALAEAAEPLLAKKYPDATKHKAVVWRMNELAQQIGMNETYFLNSIGLDESHTQSGAQSSAHDVARLFEYAFQTKKELFSATSQADMMLGPIASPPRTAHNTNDVLSEIPHLIMSKTGTTPLAGGNLAIAFEPISGHAVVVVVLGSTEAGRFEDIKKLVGAATSTLESSR